MTPFPWACPRCRQALDACLTCAPCGLTIPRLADDRPDFRITQPVTLEHRWTYEPEFGRFPWNHVSLDWPDHGHAVNGEIVERTIIRAIPEAPETDPAPLALDIGCGESRQRFRNGLSALGYRTLGLDIAGEAPDALADAHRLPLLDASVDLLVTSAVWEHLKHPHIAMQEAARVAKPGAPFIGWISFGEPFHISYFHHSPLAVYELAISAGFTVEHIILSDRYSALEAHLNMGTMGHRIPHRLHALIAGSFRWFYLLPNLFRGRARLREARLAFARSHAAGVGIIATRSLT